jgi:hypothetical protein
MINADLNPSITSLNEKKKRKHKISSQPTASFSLNFKDQTMPDKNKKIKKYMYY